jgi:metal-responsive CopG/Arc/MetJ family transcriptional regulator
MNTKSESQANLRIRFPSDLLNQIDDLVQRRHYHSRGEFIIAACAAYLDNTLPSLQAARRHQEELGSFLGYLSAAALKPQLCEEDQLTLRSMADALFLSGNTAPTDILDALEYPRAKQEAAE